ncbi:hypothetical protein VUR80DRAFT_7155 [Thermomyces stellatus]
MDSQRGGSYDPSQPWAVTDALLGILARTMIKSTYQTRLSAEAQSEAGPPESEHNVPPPRQRPRGRKPAPVSSQFWAREGKPAEGTLNSISANAGDISGPAPVGSTNDPSANHQPLSHTSPAVQEPPTSRIPSSYNHSLTQSHTHPTATDNGEGADDAQESTPDPNNSVSPMMIDPNLAGWQGESHDHEQESFLHQYSDMGGDYASVPQSMIDPNLALMHDHDDFRHERHPEDDHLDDFEAFTSAAPAGHGFMHPISTTDSTLLWPYSGAAGS